MCIEYNRKTSFIIPTSGDDYKLVMISREVYCFRFLQVILDIALNLLYETLLFISAALAFLSTNWSLINLLQIDYMIG